MNLQKDWPIIALVIGGIIVAIVLSRGSAPAAAAQPVQQTVMPAIDPNADATAVALANTQAATTQSNTQAQLQGFGALASLASAEVAANNNLAITANTNAADVQKTQSNNDAMVAATTVTTNGQLAIAQTQGAASTSIAGLQAESEDTASQYGFLASSAQARAAQAVGVASANGQAQASIAQSQAQQNAAQAQAHASQQNAFWGSIGGIASGALALFCYDRTVQAAAVRLAQTSVYDRTRPTQAVIPVFYPRSSFARP